MLRPNLNGGSKAQFVKSCTILAILVLIPLSVSLYGDEQDDTGPKEFRVDSYIPKLFKDLEWRIDGGFRLDGSNSEYDQNDQHVDAQNVNLGNYIKYRCETIQHFIEIGSGMDLDYRNSNQEYNSYHLTINANTSILKQSWEDDYYNIYTNSIIKSGLYTFNDLFFSFSSELGWQYRGNLDDSRHEYRYFSWIDTNDYITEKWIQTNGSGYGDNKRYDLDAALVIGWGRAYEGIFAASAIYIIQDLKENGLIPGEPTYEQMTQLTEILYQNRQAHAIDERISDIDAVLAIYDYLKSEGILDDNAVSHATITDIWKNYPKYSRRFGMLLNGGIGIHHFYYSSQGSSSATRLTREYYYHKDSIDSKVISEDTVFLSGYLRSGSSSTMAYLLLSCQYFKPLNHRWQMDLLSQIRHYFEAEGGSSIEFDEFYDFYNKATIRYILNTRTSIALTGVLNYGHFEREKENNSDKYTYDKWHHAFYLEGVYRISIPTSLKITAQYKSGNPTMDELYDAIYRETSKYIISASISHYLY